MRNEIVFDMIPGIPTYIEIDCKTEKELLNITNKLGLDMNQANYGAFAKQYLQYYGIPESKINHSTKSLTFANIHKEINPQTIKQKQLLKNIQKQQLKFIKSLNTKLTSKIKRSNVKDTKARSKRKSIKRKTRVKNGGLQINTSLFNLLRGDKNHTEYKLF